MREEHDDRPRKEFRLHRPMSDDEIQVALGLGQRDSLMPDGTYVVEIDGPTVAGYEFFGERTGTDTFNVVATPAYAHVVERAGQLGEFVRDC